MIEVDRLSDSRVRISPLELIGTGAGINCRKQKVGWHDGFVQSTSKKKKVVIPNNLDTLFKNQNKQNQLDNR